jgi:hypothetical protein
MVILLSYIQQGEILMGKARVTSYRFSEVTEISQQTVESGGIIMNPFSQHPHQQGISYFEHMVFALGIAARLFNSVIAFATHAIFPFIDIRKELDLEATVDFLNGQNDWIEAEKAHHPLSPVLLEE